MSSNRHKKTGSTSHFSQPRNHHLKLKQNIGFTLNRMGTISIDFFKHSPF